ncbi:MAG: hypothetical protein KBD47_01570 [Candidatus Pacebacteria bacterium]|nr:hypothetical protein [Candidatus Paceibacterota bacterium]
MDQDILKQKINELPTAYRKALGAIDLPKRLLKIRDLEELSIDQISEIEVEIILSILGLRSPEDFVEEIQKKLEVDEDKAISITDTVNNEIFLPLRSIIQQGAAIEPEHRLETPDEILKHIEDGGLELPSATPPAPLVEEPAPAPTPAPTPTPTVEESKDLTEHLLKNTVASPHIEETKVEKKYNIDPYREPIM